MIKIPKLEQARREKILSWIKGENILNMGCCDYVFKKYPMHYFLKKKLKNKNIVGLDCVECNCTDINLDLNKKKYSLKSKSYDTIIAGELMEHLSHPMIFLEECYRILTKGGRLIITTPSMFSILYLFGILRNSDKGRGHCHAWNMMLFDDLLVRTKFKVIHKEKFNCLVDRDFLFDWFTKIFSIFKTNLFYVLEK